MNRRFFMLVSMLACVAGPPIARCQAPAANPTEPPRTAATGSSAEAPDIAEAVKAIIDKTNDFRKENGQDKLAVNSKLSAAASHFAEFMAANVKYGHDADGRHPDERAVKEGYSYCLIGENIAYLYDPAGFTTKRLADELFQGWKKSPGHRHNMLDPDMTDTGVAIARSDVNGYYYAVQMVGRPKSLAINFEIKNETSTSLECKLGSEKFSMPANSHRSCELSRPEILIVDFPADKKHNLTTFTKTVKTANGENIVISNGNEGFQIGRKPTQGDR